MKELRLGVIPFMNYDDKEVIIITSRKSGKWIFPKGKPESNMTHEEVAIMEAYEEAGVIGNVLDIEPFYFHDDSNGNTSTTILFPMKITEVLEEWPEANQRSRKILSFKKAMNHFNNKYLIESLQVYLKKIA